MREMVILRENRIGYEELPSDEYIIKFTKFGMDRDITLKNLSRLACVKWFSEEYMGQRLPKCLHRYLGIEK